MSTISKELRTTAIFKCIVTLKNGFHKTLRMQVNKVAAAGCRAQAAQADALAE